MANDKTWESQADLEKAKSLNVLINTKKDLERKLITSDATLADKDRTMKTLENTLADTKQKLTDTDQKLKTSENTLADTKQKLADTDQKLKTSENTLADTKQKLADTDQKLKTSENTLADTKQKLADTDQKLKTSENTLADTKQKLADTDQKLKTSENTLADTKQKLADTDQKLKTSENTLADTKQKLADTDQKLRTSEKTLVDTKQKLADTDQKLKTSEKTLADTKQKLADTDQKLKTSENTLADTKQKLADTDQKLKTSENTLADTKQKLADTDQKLKTSEKTLTDTKQKLADTDQKLKTSEKTLADTEQKFKISENRLDIENQMMCLKTEHERQRRMDKNIIQKKEKELDEIRNDAVKTKTGKQKTSEELQKMTAQDKRPKENIDIGRMIVRSTSLLSKANSMIHNLGDNTGLDTTGVDTEVNVQTADQAPYEFGIEKNTLQQETIEDKKQTTGAKNGEERNNDTSSETTIRPPCDLCAEDDVHIDSEHYCTNCNDFLCNNCKKMHIKSKASKHHAIYSREQMPLKRIARGENRICEKHTDETFKFRCFEHEVFVCAVCVTIEHKGCTFEYINTIGERFPSSKEYMDLQSDIQGLVTASDQKEREIHSKESVFKNQFDELRQAISVFQLQLINKIRKVEAEMIIQTEMWNQIMFRNADTGIKTLQCVNENLKEMLSVLKDLEKFKQYEQLVITASKSASKLGDIRKQMDKVDSTSVVIETDCNEMSDEIRKIIRLVKLNIDDDKQVDDDSMQNDVVEELEISGQEMYESIN